jgi:ribose 1,5-bisphosphokinase PhnN
VLAARLQERGREDSQAQAQRLARAEMGNITGVFAVIVNDDAFDMALEAFMKAIEPEAASAAASTALPP